MSHKNRVCRSLWRRAQIRARREECDRVGGIQTIDKIFEITVYQVLILPAKYLAHGWVAEKDFTSGRKDEHDCLAHLGYKEICPTFASRKLPWVNILLTLL